MFAKLGRKKSKGFTLVEVVVVVGIMVASMAVLGVPASDMVKSFKQLEADAIAREMYVVAQDSLTKLKSSGNTQSIALGDNVTTSVSFVGEDGVTRNVVPIKSLVINSNTSQSTIDLLFNSNKINDAYVQDSWVVEYDPTTGIVTSVFYADSEGDASFYDSAYRDTLRQSKANRLDFYDEKGYPVGYYGNSDAYSYEEAKGSKAGRCGADVTVLDTKESLKLQFKVTSPTSHIDKINENCPVALDVTYVGETSGKSETVRVMIYPGIEPGTELLDANGNKTGIIFVSGDGSEEHPFILEKVVDSKTTPFSTLFPDFYAGENMIVTAIASVPGLAGERTDSDPAIKRFNPLYGALEPGLEYENAATVDNERHLRNLNNADNHIKIEQVIQTSDINLGGSSNPFTPIDNSSIISYEGNNHSIINAYVNVDGNAGFFKTFGQKAIDGQTPVKSEIKNLNIVDSTFISTGNGNAGSLIGEAKDNVTIEGCGAYLTTKYTDEQNENPANHIMVQAKDGCAGGLVGKAGTNLGINKSYAATIVDGNTWAGGLVGYAETGARFTYSYADCYIHATNIGGLAGYAAGSYLNNCYAAGFSFGSGIEKGCGLIGGKVGEAINSYTVFELDNVKESWSTFTDIEQNADGTPKTLCICYHANLSANHDIYVTLADNTTTMAAAKAVIHEDLSNANMIQTNLGDGKFIIDGSQSTPYNFSAKGLTTYPYPIIDGLPHVGDWTTFGGSGESAIGDDVVGFFYWEKETGSDHHGYNYYVVDSNGKVTADTLCKEHDDDGDIIEYGYGYMVKTKYYDDFYINWDANSVEVETTAKGLHTLKAQTNGAAESAIKKSVDPKNEYTVVCYTTMDSSKDADDASVKGKYLYLKNYTTYTTVQFSYVKDSRTYKTFSYAFCPFFAADIVAGTGVIDYNAKYNVGTASHQIRSIEQLQYLNWNWYEGNCQTQSTWYNRYGFSFLNVNTDITYAVIGFSVSKYINFDSSVYEQTHDFEATGYSNYTPIAALGTVAQNTSGLALLENINSIDTATGLNSNLYVYNWFGSKYDGNSYQIRNLNITSNAYTVGLFGTVVGARLENIIMTTDNGSVIRRTTFGDKDSIKVGNEVLTTGRDNYVSDYFIGGLVGLAGRSSIDVLNVCTINNCAIGGYEIIDQTKHATTYGGGANVGGLVGASTCRIWHCSAVVDIKMQCTSTMGVTMVGGLVGSANGSYGSYGGPTIYECYTGGSISFADCTNANRSSSLFKEYIVAGIVGSNRNVKIHNIYQITGSETNAIAIMECYTYMTLPTDSSSDNIDVIGIIFGTDETSVTATARTALSSLKFGIFNLNGTNMVVNCSYYEDNLPQAKEVEYGVWPFKKTYEGNFIENGQKYYYGSSGNYKQSVVKSMYTNVLVFYVDDNILSNLVSGKLSSINLSNVGLGVHAYDYNEMAALGGNKYANITYPCTASNSVVTCNTGSSNPNAYPFKTVLTRGNSNSSKTVHVGSWPTSSYLTLSKGECDADTFRDIRLTLKTNDKVSTITDISGWYWTGYNFEGYYYGTEKIINADGTFVASSSLVKNGKWVSTNTSLVLTAKWTPVTYSIGYEYNGGTAPATANPTSYTVKETVTIANQPTKDGYIFAGWTTDSTAKTGAQTVEIEKETVSGNLTYYATWSPIPYAITYEYNGGTAPTTSNPTSYDASADVVIANEPTRKGYTFEGWAESSTATSGSKTITITAGSAKGAKTYYATWKLVTYTITYDYKGGSAPTTANPTSYDVTVSKTISHKPGRTGYTFNGWSEDSNATSGSQSVTIAVGTTGNKKYYATWTPITYTIVCNLNGGTKLNGATKNSTTGNYEYKYKITDNTFTLGTPERTGYDFVGWKDSQNNVSSSVAITKGSTGDKSYTATWTPHEYTIACNLNGGTELDGATKNSTTGNYEYKYKITSNTFELGTPERTGYDFVGWKDSQNNVTSPVAITKGSTGDKSYTATWTPINYTISYNLDGGNVSTANRTNYTVADSFKLNNPTKSGYEFRGWYDGTNNLGTDVTVSNTTGNKSYTAIWGYTITLHSGYFTDGNADHTVPVTLTTGTSGYSVSVPSMKTRTVTGGACKLAGWGVQTSNDTVIVLTSQGALKSDTAKNYLETDGSTTLHAIWSIEYSNAYVNTTSLDGSGSYLIANTNTAGATTNVLAYQSDSHKNALKVESVNSVVLAAAASYLDDAGTSKTAYNVTFIPGSYSSSYAFTSEDQRLKSPNNTFLSFKESWLVEYPYFVSDKDDAAKMAMWGSGFLTSVKSFSGAYRSLSFNDSNYCVTYPTAEKNYSSHGVYLFKQVTNVKIVEYEQ